MFRLTFILALVLFASKLMAQDDASKTKHVYTTSSGEMIFSLANMKLDGADVDGILRYSPVFNFQNLVVFDKGTGPSLFTGFCFRNVGFIYEVPNSNIRKKVRSYNIGIPIGIQLGKRNGFSIYGGYELEIPINYKEKTFINDSKDDKFNTWFSKRTNTLNSSLFVGIQLIRGTNIKFKYYLTNFYNKNYTQKDSQGVNYKPYQDFNVNVFYFSLTFDLFKNLDFQYSDRF